LPANRRRCRRETTRSDCLAWPVRFPDRRPCLSAAIVVQPALLREYSFDVARIAFEVTRRVHEADCDTNATLELFSRKPVVVRTTPPASSAQQNKTEPGSLRLSPSCDLPPDVGPSLRFGEEYVSLRDTPALQTRVENRSRIRNEPRGRLDIQAVCETDTEAVLDLTPKSSTNPTSKPLRTRIENRHRNRQKSRQNDELFGDENRHRNRQKSRQNDELFGDKMTQAIRLDPTRASRAASKPVALGNRRAAAKRCDPTAPRGPYV